MPAVVIDWPHSGVQTTAESSPGERVGHAAGQPTGPAVVVLEGALDDPLLVVEEELLGVQRLERVLHAHARPYCSSAAGRSRRSRTVRSSPRGARAARRSAGRRRSSPPRRTAGGRAAGSRRARRPSGRRTSAGTPSRRRSRSAPRRRRSCRGRRPCATRPRRRAAPTGRRGRSRCGRRRAEVRHRRGRPSRRSPPKRPARSSEVSATGAGPGRSRSAGRSLTGSPRPGPR